MYSWKFLILYFFWKIVKSSLLEIAEVVYFGALKVIVELVYFGMRL